jgi:hypothetical protein
MGGTGEHHLQWSKPGSEGQKSYVFFHIWNIGPIQIQAILWKIGHPKGTSLMGEGR